MEQGNTFFSECFDPTFWFVLKTTRLEDEARYHQHESALELCYVQSGRGRYLIDDVIYEVGEGDLIIINAGVMHRSLTIEGQMPKVELYLGVTDLYVKNCKPNCLPYMNGTPVLHTSGDLKLKLNKLFVSMDVEQEAPRTDRYYMLKLYSMQIIILLLREMQQSQVRELPENQCSFESFSRKYVVERIIEYFEDHYGDKISLDQIAGNMYLSPYYVSRIFKLETGDTPIHYLINVRMQRAEQLLLHEPQLSIQEVAGRVGYDDAYHFSKLFKKKFGVSPSAYRNAGLN